MNKNIAVLPGDGIGPEIIEQAVKVLDAVAKKYNHIKPALVLVFDNHIPMPIREHKWEEYLNFIKEIQSCSQN